jgi:glutathione synthase
MPQGAVVVAKKTKKLTSIFPLLVSVIVIINSAAFVVETTAFSILMTTTATTTTAASMATAPASSQLLLLSETNRHLLDELAVAANAFSSAHGIQVESRTTDAGGSSSSSTSSTTTTTYKSAPISLLPNAYPKPAFDQAVALAPAFNKLVDAVSRDAHFLRETLGGSVASADPFTARLLQLYQEIYVNDATKVPAALSADRLGIHRSDYMLHKETTNDNGNDYSIKQVELNTIAASFAGLSCQVAALHQYLTRRYDSQTVREFLQTNQRAVGGRVAEFAQCHVPNNPTLEKLPYAMQIVVERYKARFVTIKDVAVLFVVQEGETNTVDQRLLEFQLFQRHGIPVLRASLGTINAHATLSKDDGRLVLFDKEIALVYFRAGYAPTDYFNPGDAEWSARALLERCRAAKCPSLGYHLAGTKKVQQALARPGVLERFISNVDDAQALRSAFAGLYSLDGADMTADDFRAIRQVLLDETAADRYVLKPQREGGGYNFYGKDLRAKITANVTVQQANNHNDGDDDDAAQSLTLHESLGEYILMERLFPPQQTAVLMRNGRVEGTGDSISELGCFGTIIATGDDDDDGTVVHNEYAGFLLRTKFSNVNEGGVASGFATLSSPYLC